MLKRLMALFTLAFCALILAPSITHATDVLPDTETVNAADTIASLRLDAVTVTFIISVFIPILTGLLTKLNLSGYIKGLITLVLNLIASAVVAAQLADGAAVWTQSTLITTLFGFVISVAMYLGIWKPANITSSTPEGKLAPAKGLG